MNNQIHSGFKISLMCILKWDRCVVVLYVCIHYTCATHLDRQKTLKFHSCVRYLWRSSGDKCSVIQMSSCYNEYRRAILGWW